MKSNPVLNAIIGVCVGDALGVPVEFKSRDYLSKNPVEDMFGFGTYKQPPGTWSDDSALTLCLAESLCKGYDLSAIAQSFVNWYHKSHWTPHGSVFDSGETTRKAISNLFHGQCAPQEAGLSDEKSNGNGSLMRILPIAFYVKGRPVEERFRIVADVSSLTHGHLRTIMSCNAYIDFALNLLDGYNLKESYQGMQERIRSFYQREDEIRYLYNVLEMDISEFPERQIRSSGYVVHTLEASLWCLFNSGSYRECVLKAVNLGDDSDTTGSVAGGLAGIHFGFENIPSEWVNKIARKDEILELCERMENVYFPVHSNKSRN